MSHVRLYINGRFLMQELTGVNRFAYEMCRALHNQNVDFELLCPHDKIKSCYNIDGFRIRYCGFGYSHIWEQIALPIYFNHIRGKKLLLNFTSLSPIMVRCKYMTIHDMAYRVNPSWFSKSYSLLYRFLTPLSAKTALRIITVSEFSKKEIIRWLGIDEKKISVIYNAVPNMFMEYLRESNVSLTSERYVLAVSSLDPRKNFINLLKAFALIDEPNLKLYVIGGENPIYRTSIASLSNSTNQKNVTWLGRVSDQELVQYYKNAEAFIYPSLYEGFGIPPLEAMACKTAVIASDIPPHREVCGDVAEYFNPRDSQNIAQKLSILIKDKAKIEKLKLLGPNQAAKFSWERSAQQLSNLIEQDYPTS